MIKDINTELGIIRVYFENSNNPIRWNNKKRKTYGYPLRRRCGYHQTKEKYYKKQMYKLLNKISYNTLSDWGIYK